jgi:hypothetical protein
VSGLGFRAASERWHGFPLVDADPFEILPAQPQVDAALQIKNPDTCDICWGAEGVKGKIPVFWIEGLGVERDGKTITPLFFEKVMPPAARARR